MTEANDAYLIGRDRAFLGFVKPSMEADGCYEWTGHVSSDGYGKFRVGKRTMAASRYVMMRKFGVDAIIGLEACHSCDNPSCVNPAHLRLDTCRNNGMEALSKGRKRPPSHAKTTQDVADKIRCDFHTLHESHSVLAHRYGVHRRVVCDIVHNKIWIRK